MQHLLHASNASAGVFTAEAFLWAVCTVRARVHAPLEGEQVALVPFADLVSPCVFAASLSPRLTISHGEVAFPSWLALPRKFQVGGPAPSQLAEGMLMLLQICGFYLPTIRLPAPLPPHFCRRSTGGRRRGGGTSSPPASLARATRWRCRRSGSWQRGRRWAWTLGRARATRRWGEEHSFHAGI